LNLTTFLSSPGNNRNDAPDRGPGDPAGPAWSAGCRWTAAIYRDLGLITDLYQGTSSIIRNNRFTLMELRAAGAAGHHHPP